MRGLTHVDGMTNEETKLKVTPICRECSLKKIGVDNGKNCRYRLTKR